MPVISRRLIDPLLISRIKDTIAELKRNRIHAIPISSLPFVGEEDYKIFLSDYDNQVGVSYTREPSIVSPKEFEELLCRAVAVMMIDRNQDSNSILATGITEIPEELSTPTNIFAVAEPKDGTVPKIFLWTKEIGDCQHGHICLSPVS